MKITAANRVVHEDLLSGEGRRYTVFQVALDVPHATGDRRYSGGYFVETVMISFHEGDLLTYTEATFHGHALTKTGKVSTRRDSGHLSTKIDVTALDAPEPSYVAEWDGLTKEQITRLQDLAVMVARFVGDNHPDKSK